MRALFDLPSFPPHPSKLIAEKVRRVAPKESREDRQRK